MWDTTAADSTLEELAYFAGLKFAVPTATSQIHALPLQHMLDWLLNPNGPPLMEGDKCNVQGHVPHRVFALLAVPRFLYGPGGMPSPNPMIGIGVVFIPPYVKKLSFTDAYFFLNQCVRIGSKPLEEEQVVFLNSSSKSTAIPHLHPYPLWLDYATKDLIKEAPRHAPLCCFRAFCLHRIVAVAPEELSGLAQYVYTPHCKGHDPFLEPNVPEAVPESSVKWTQNEARPGDDEGEDSELLGLTGGLLDTQLSTDVKEDVDVLLGSIRSFQLQVLYEMGSVRMVDQVLTEGFSTEFLRLSRVVTEDLSKSLCHHHERIQEGASDLKAFMYKLTSHPLLVKHSDEVTAAVEKFRQTAAMNLLLPLLHLDSARGNIARFMNSHLKEVCEKEESKVLIEALMECLTNLQSQTWRLVRSSKLSDPEVAN